MKDNLVPPLVSLIVPVYQAEQYIKRCVNSILAQDYNHLQILLIDDGSIDDSYRICDELAASDERIKAIHQENKGVSAARNKGIINASGEWMAFVDSDDTVDDHYISRLIQNVVDSDMIMSGLNLCYKTAVKALEMPDRKYVPSELLDDLVKKYDIACISSPCCKLFKSSFINEYGLRFDESVSMGEDMLFVLSYLEHCKTISSISYCGYNYNKTNSKSLMTVFNINYYDMRLLVYGTIIDCSNKWNCSEETKQRLSIAYAVVLFNTICQAFNKKSQLTNEQKNILIKRFLNDPIVCKSLAKNRDKRARFIMLRFFAKFKTQSLMFFILYVRFFILGQGA